MKSGFLLWLAAGAASLGTTAGEAQEAVQNGQGKPVATAPDQSRASGQPGAARPPERKCPWTILVYGAVDNSADEPLIEFLEKMRRAIDNDRGIELLLFIDRSDEHKKVPTYLG